MKNNTAKENLPPLSKNFLHSLIILSSVAGFLTAFFVIGSLIQANQRTYDPGSVANFLSSNIDVSQITIRSQDSSDGDAPNEIVLNMVNDIWTVEDSATPNSLQRGRGERIEEFIDAILSLEFLRRVSSNDESISEFGLENDAQIISFYDRQDRLISRFFFGSSDPLRSEQYFMISDVSEVFSIDTAVQFYLDQSINFWTELRFWNIEEDLAIRFQRSYPDTSRNVWIRNEEEEWIASNSNASPSTENESSEDIDTVVRSFFSLEAERVLDDLPSNANYLAEVEVETQGGNVYRVSFFQVIPEVIASENEESSNAEDATPLPVYYAQQSELGAFLSPSGATRTYIIPAWRFRSIVN